MSLQMILGSAGSGKSSYLYDYILEEAKKNPNQNYLMLVPEQFTMSTQREFVLRAQNNCIMNVDVLSFERLAYRVFEELGISDLTVLEDLGKTLLIRQVVKEKEKELRILKRNIDKPGYLDQLKSIITEFAQYHISLAQLEEAKAALKNEAGNELLYLKMQDLTAIFAGYEEKANEGFVTNEKLLTTLATVAKDSEILKDAVVAFDGYTGFTPVQNVFLKSLFPLVKEILVTVKIDPKEEWMNPQGSYELFYLSKKYIQNLMRIAKDCQVPVLDPIMMKAPSQEGRRFEHAKGLAAIEANLYRHPEFKCQDEVDDVVLWKAHNPKQELETIASIIDSYVRKGYRYKDFAICCSDLEGYSDDVLKVFSMAGIPHFIDKKERMVFSSPLEFLKGIVDCFCYNFRLQDVMRFLKSDLTNLDREEVDKLENYCLKYRISGRKKWEAPFCKWEEIQKDDKRDEVKETAEFSRKQVMELLEPCLSLNQEASVEDWIRGLYECMVSCELEKKLEEMANYFAKQKNYKLQKQYEGSFRLIIELFDKMVAIMGEEVLDIKEFAAVLYAGLDFMKVAKIPAGRDCVIVGDINRTRLEHIKVLFFIGVNEGLVPKVTTGSICITQAEREKLLNLELELADGPRDRVFTEQFYLYNCLTKPSEKLYVSYPDYGVSLEAMRPAYLVQSLSTLLNDKKTVKAKTLVEALPMESQYIGEAFAFEKIMEKLVSGQKLSESESEVLSHFASVEPYRSRLLNAVLSIAKRLNNDHLSKEMVEALYGKVINGSVTRLEKYASCAMLHFLKYGLRLNSREDGEFTALDLGNIFHESLELFGQAMVKRGYQFNNVPKQVRDELLEMALNQAILDVKYEYIHENKRNEYLKIRIMRILKRTIWALGVQSAENMFVPMKFENSFYIGDSENKGYRLSGKIDRIDERHGEDAVYFRVIDYKSSAKDADLGKLMDGISLQLYTYLDAAYDLVSKEHEGEKVICDGAFYYHLDDPFPLEKDNPEEAMLSDLRLNGIARVEDRTITKKSAMGSEAIDITRQYVLKKVESLCADMATGNITPQPFVEEKTCQFCEYKAICGYNEQKDKNTRRCTKLKKEEALAAMKKELEKG